MDNLVFKFEIIVRKSVDFIRFSSRDTEGIHPFESHNIHEILRGKVKGLFDNGHFAQATFEAFKLIDNEIKRYSGSQESGHKLMLKVFSENSPTIKLNPCKTISEKDEQKGFQFIFAGSILAIRNPRGHEYSIKDTKEQCLDHLSLVSLLIRRLEKAGYNIVKTFK